MGSDLRLLLPAPARRFPADLALVAGLALLTVAAALVPGLRETPLRIVLAFPFVAFLPGYALVALLFPEAGRRSAQSGLGSGSGAGQTEPAVEGADDAGLSPDDEGIDGLERLTLSIGLSIAIVPLIGLVLDVTPFGIRLVPILVCATAVTIGCAIGAAYRRWQLPERERFRVPFRAWGAWARRAAFSPGSRLDALLNVVLVLSVLVAVASVAYVSMVPALDDRFTEFYLLTEGEDGELVADGYPEELVAGEPAEVVVGVANEEYEPAEYTVVVQLQAVDRPENVSVADDPEAADEARVEVLERQRLATLETGTLEHGEEWHRPHDVVVDGPLGETDHRLQFLLYRGDAPSEASAETAYRNLHLWVAVEEAV